MGPDRWADALRNPATRRLRTAGLQLADAAVIARSGAFDRPWYALQTGRRFGSTEAAVTHYVRTGRRAGLSPHPLFEASWVDPTRWATSRRDPYATFLRGAASDRQSPHPCFDPVVWSARHPAAARDPLGAFGHFLRHAREDTVLPLVDELAGAPAPAWGQFRRASWERARAWVAERAVVQAPRTTSRHDEEADAAYVRRWSTAPLPARTEPLVSVVMPVRNRPDAVRRAIASVRSQTLGSWELVVVDDGSDDQTPDVVAAVAAQEPRLVLVRAPHQGVSAARNLGARHARGRYLAWLDSDNVWTPHFLRTAVAAVHGAGTRAAYARAELRSPSGTRYRALDAGADHLAERNHVDLNVLVAERSLVEEVGGFDESLRRTVDYDLVWSLAERTRLLHLPFVGVVYDEDGAADRVTTRELRSWRDVVRSKHLVDWAGLERAHGERREGRTSVVVAARTGWQPAWRSARAVLDADRAESGPEDRHDELVVVDSALCRGDSAVLHWLVTLAGASPGGGAPAAPAPVRLGTTGHTALTWNVGLARTTGDVVAFLDEGVRPAEGWLRPARQALVDPEVGVVQPLVLSPAGEVASAGGLFTPVDPLPATFLRGCALDDADRLAGPVAVGCADGPAVVLRARDAVGARGFTCLYVDGWEAADLSLRLLRSGGLRTVCVPASRVTAASSDPFVDASRESANRRLFRDTWRDGLPAPTVEPWAQVGLGVARHEPAGADGQVEPRRPWPVLVAARGPATVGAPRLRWAIKTAVPFGQDAHRWGDLHFGDALAQALRRLGQDVRLDYRGSLERATAGLDDVVLALRGRVAVPVQPGSVHVLWVISHPDQVGEEELRSASLVFAASAPWAERTTRRIGRPVTALLQATDPERFRPDVASPDTGERVLFVGNSRNVYRPVVRHLVDAGLPVAVYGGRWEQFIDDRHLRADHVDNADLARHYRSAGVVLNDHWDGMRQEGFLSNRLFDAVAAGARVISDDVPGTEVFDGVVRTFRDGPELVGLVERYPDLFPPPERRLEVAERVRREHSFDARARTLLDAVLAARRPGR